MIEICQERKELFSIFHKGETLVLKTNKMIKNKKIITNKKKIIFILIFQMVGTLNHRNLYLKKINKFNRFEVYIISK